MKKKNFFFAWLAIAALAAGGFAYSYANVTDSQLTAVQLETLEALTHDENVLVKDCPNPQRTECARILQGNTVHIFYTEDPIPGVMK